MTSGSPTQDGRFLLLDTVGRGATASVMRAYDRVHQRLVALKLFRNSRSRSRRHPAATEFAACSRVRHSGVVDLYELGRARHGPLPPGQPYLVMQWIDGLPIDRAVTPGRVTNRQLHQIAAQSLFALSSVHDAGIVHRDIKPANLLAMTSPKRGLRVVLTDFGLAVEAGHTSIPGFVSGTLRQIAPEAILGSALDGRADLYSLGLLLAFLATGEQPCPADPLEAITWHLSGALLKLKRRGLSRPMLRLIAKLTGREKESRPKSAREALVTLGISRDEIVTAGRSSIAAYPQPYEEPPLRGRRIVTLPRDSNARALTIRAARSAAETRGIPFHHWTGDRDGLRRLALRLALLDLDRARERIGRYRLDTAIGLGWVGGVPMLFEPPPPSQTDAAARRIACFILEFANEGMLVLALERETGEAGLALLREASRRLNREPGTGGFVIFVDAATDRRWRSLSPANHIAPTD